MTPCPTPLCRQPPSGRLARIQALLTVLGCLLYLPLLHGCEKPVQPTVVESAPLPELEAECVKIQLTTWPQIVRSQGSLMADEVTQVGTRVAGRIEAIHVDLGDQVTALQPLATLESSEFTLQVAQVEAQLLQARAAVGLQEGEPTAKLNPENAPPVRQEKALWEEAKTKLARMNQLVSQQAVTAVELDQIVAAERVAEARYSASLNSVREKIALIFVREAELSLAKQRLQDAVIVAPFPGRVQLRSTSPGTYVNVGDSIATIVRTDQLRFRGTLPEKFSRLLRLGQQVALRIESTDQPRNVAVSRISPMLDPLSRSLVFEAVLDNTDGELQSGIFAEADITVDDQAQSIVVPLQSTTQFAGAEKVWKVVDGVAMEQEVFLGARRDNQVQVLEGLAAGDVILQNAAEGRVAKIICRPVDSPAAANTSVSDKSSASDATDLVELK